MFSFTKYAVTILCFVCWPFVVWSDDSCHDFNQRVKQFVATIPSLTESQLSVGRFDVEEFDAETRSPRNRIRYSANGKVLFEYDWKTLYDEDAFAPDWVLPVRSIKGFNGIYLGIAMRHISPLSCSHLVVPSLQDQGFKIFQESEHPIYILDLDNDNRSEIVKLEVPKWTYECGMCEACRDNMALPNIYHLTSLNGDLTLVNNKFPAFYAEHKKSIFEQYNYFKLYGKKYINNCQVDFLDSKFQETLSRLEVLAIKSQNKNQKGADQIIDDRQTLAMDSSTPEKASSPSSADLLIRIDKALTILPKPSDYLYETASLRGKIVGTWTEMTAGILGTRDLRVAYDNFYQSAVDYAGLDEINLIHARKAALDNDVNAANRLFEAAQRYESQFYLNDKAATESFYGNIDAAAKLARGIYEGSKAATIYGSSMVLGPVGSRVVDTVFDTTDFAVEASDSGLTSAAKKLVAGKFTEMIFSQTTVTTLGGKTLKDALDKGVINAMGNSEVYRIVGDIVTKPDFAKAFMGFIAKSGSHVATRLTESQVNKVVMAVMEGIANKTPLLTGCGSENWQKYLLQYNEVVQATIKGGYSFNVICQAHDACYGDCQTDKSDCDKNLLSDAERVCESLQNKALCIADAKLYFTAVSKVGGSSFTQARANCPATTKIVVPTIQTNKVVPLGNTAKESAKKDCQQRFNYSSAVTGVGAQSALSKYALDQDECQ